jgi:pimeloyl-ACP methyl ester carboxylesterase
MAFDATYAFVHNEDCNLHYWHRGTGPLLFFIPGGSGDGSQYNPMITLLSTSYTCATFDRRQMSGSKTPTNKLLNPPQQARDIVTIIKALGFEKAIVFGSSLGGVLGFQLAIDHPEVVDHLICHEAPTFMLLPDSTECFEHILLLLSIYHSSGPQAAFAEFMKIFKGHNEDGIPAFSLPSPENAINFLENELLLATTWNPDWRKIVRNGVSVSVMAGKRSVDAIYVRTTVEQQEVLGCERMVVPGHHGGFEVESEAFMPALLEMIDILEKKRMSAT